MKNQTPVAHSYSVFDFLYSALSFQFEHMKPGAMILSGGKLLIENPESLMTLPAIINISQNYIIIVQRFSKLVPNIFISKSNDYTDFPVFVHYPPFSLYLC